MGQSRYERLPKSQNWRNVVAVLSSQKASVAEVAGATAKACRVALKRHSTDPVLVNSVYVLACLCLTVDRQNASLEAVLVCTDRE